MNSVVQPFSGDLEAEPVVPTKSEETLASTFQTEPAAPMQMGGVRLAPHVAPTNYTTKEKTFPGAINWPIIIGLALFAAYFFFGKRK